MSSQVHYSPPNPTKFFTHFALGCGASLAGQLIIHLIYMAVLGIPNPAHPITYLFWFPLLWCIVFCIAGVLELLLQRKFRAPATLREAFVFGAFGATFYIYWVFPLHQWVLLLVNPFLLRWFYHRQNTTATPAPAHPPKKHEVSKSR